MAKFLLHCNEPRISIAVDASLSINEFLAFAKQALGEELFQSGTSVILGQYGKDVQELDFSPSDASVSSVGIIAGAWVCVFRPVEIERRGPPCKTGEAKDEGDDDQDDDRFKFISQSTFWKMLKSNKKGKRRKLLLAYLDENAMELLARKEVRQLSKSDLIEVFKRPSLGIESELDLVNVACEWGQLRPSVKRGEMTLQQALADIIPHIRFPRLTVQEFATVADKKLFTEGLQLQMFVYLSQAQNNESVPLPKSLKMFETKQRASAGACCLTYDKKQCPPNFELLNNGKTARMTTHPRHSIWIHCPGKPSRIRFRAKIDCKSSWVAVGFGSVLYNYSDGKYSGQGYGAFMYSYNGYCWNAENSTQNNKGSYKKYNSGDIVSVEYNAQTASIRYWLNDDQLVLTQTKIPKGVKPMVHCMVANEQISLLPWKKPSTY